MAGREKSAAHAGAPTTAGAKNDETGQVMIFRAEAVRDPRAHRWSRGGDVAGMKEAARRSVRGVEGVHGADDAKVVGASSEVGKKLADFQPGPAMFLKGKRRRKQATGGAFGAQIDRIGALAR